VQDQQVESFDAELPGRLVERMQSFVVAEVGDPNLGFDEDVVARQPGLMDGLADLPLVAVPSGGVDVTVTDRPATRFRPR
jgi:hypothetical protein